jgi:hypothetical protein
MEAKAKAGQCRDGDVRCGSLYLLTRYGADTFIFLLTTCQATNFNKQTFGDSQSSAGWLLEYNASSCNQSNNILRDNGF